MTQYRSEVTAVGLNRGRPSRDLKADFEKRLADTGLFESGGASNTGLYSVSSAANGGNGSGAVEIGAERAAYAKLRAKYAAARFVRSARLKANLTQQQLAEKLEVTQGFVSSVENVKSDKPVSLTFLFEVSFETGVLLFLGDADGLENTESADGLEGVLGSIKIKIF